MQLSLVDRCLLRRLQSVETSGALGTQLCISREEMLLGAYSYQMHYVCLWFIERLGRCNSPVPAIAYAARVGLSEVNGVRVPLLSHPSQTGLGPCVPYRLNDISIPWPWVFCCCDRCRVLCSTTVILYSQSCTADAWPGVAGQTPCQHKSELNMIAGLTKDFEGSAVTMRLG
jgi:hypothetical protein